MSTCLVRAADYRRYWSGTPEPPATVSCYAGPDRRVLADRRAPGHERRWDASQGRRWRERRRRSL